MKRPKIPKLLLPPSITKQKAALESTDLDGYASVRLAGMWYLLGFECQQIGAMLEKHGKKELYAEMGMLPVVMQDDSATEGDKE